MAEARFFDFCRLSSSYIASKVDVNSHPGKKEFVAHGLSHTLLTPQTYHTIQWKDRDIARFLRAEGPGKCFFVKWKMKNCVLSASFQLVETAGVGLAALLTSPLKHKV
jgi:hypothetical protein